jgi:hypothetical protein
MKWIEFILVESYEDLLKEWRYMRAIKMKILKPKEYVTMTNDELDSFLRKKLSE